MKTIEQNAAVLGPAPWLPVNRLQNNFDVNIAIIPSPGAVLTTSVQYTLDGLSDDFLRPISITRAATVATIRDLNHGLSVGDSVIIQYAGAPFNGTFPVATVIDIDTYTIVVANSGSLVDSGFAKAKNLRVFTHATLTALVARATGALRDPVTAIRQNVSAYTSGSSDMVVQQGMGH